MVLTMIELAFALIHSLFASLCSNKFSIQGLNSACLHLERAGQMRAALKMENSKMIRNIPGPALGDRDYAGTFVIGWDQPSNPGGSSPARPPCQQTAPLGNNLCLMNKHIWDMAHVLGSSLRNSCHPEYEFDLGSLILNQVDLRLSGVPGISGL